MRSFTSFGGITAAQYLIDFYLWECILNENPQLKTIIEFGTWRGGFSWYLYSQAKVRNMSFITYDSIIHFKIRPPGFVKRDIFADYEEIGRLISLGPCAVLCDNGNKPREVKTFAPYLTNDSIMIAHDWNTEFFEEDIPEYMEQIYTDFCDEIGSISRVLRKKVE